MKQSQKVMSYMYKYLKRNKMIVMGAISVVTIIIISLLAPVISPYNPNSVNVGQRLDSPSFAHILGTDQLGRDMLSRLLYGSQITLRNAFLVLIGILILGIPAGIIAGYIGGKTDLFIMRIVDIILTFPSGILALAVVSVLGPGMFNIMIVLVSLWWAPFARVVRGSVLKVKEKDFIMVAEGIGTSKFKIITKHILTNVLSPIIVLATLNIASIIMHIAGFSFIGLGTQPPNADWGVMLNDSREFLDFDPFLAVWPGLAVMITVLAMTMLGEGLNDTLSPRTQVQKNGKFKP